MLCCHLICALLLGVGDPPPADPVTRPLSPHEETWHAVNRLAFGPRPGQVEELKKSGWREWFEEQLDPGSVDDSQLESILHDRYPSLRMDLQQAWTVYWPPTPENFDEMSQEERDAFFRHRNDQYTRIQRELPESVLVRAAYSKRQFQEVMVEFWRNHFNIDQSKGFCRLFANHYEENVIRRHAFGRFEEMLLASARHPAMSIYLDNEISQKPLTKSELEVLEQVRKKRLANPNAPLGMVAERITRHRGLNENYARELMELHTLGVDNYYEQRDVRELARVLTGWTHGWEGDPYESPYGFVFSHGVHDTRKKAVLGKRFGGKGGEREGLTAIRRLARHPGTADFIAWKLCRYLVNDEPPPSLVAKAAETFRSRQGHLPDVYRTIVLSPEFLHRANYRAKFKSPFEFVVTALRATDAQVFDGGETLFRLSRMGQPIYRCEDPTGYFDQTEAWLDPGVFVHRWEFALALVAGHVKGVRVSESLFAEWKKAPLDQTRARIVTAWLPEAPPERAAALLEKAKDERGAAGLVLGLPSFQKQ